MAHRAINLVDKRLAPEGFDILFFRHGVVRMAWVITNAVSRPVVKPMASLVAEWPTCDSATIIFFKDQAHRTKRNGSSISPRSSIYASQFM
eukprot:2712014-Prymnesium_polylepis.1